MHSGFILCFLMAFRPRPNGTNIQSEITGRLHRYFITKQNVSKNTSQHLSVKTHLSHSGQKVSCQLKQPPTEPCPFPQAATQLPMVFWAPNLIRMIRMEPRWFTFRTPSRCVERMWRMLDTERTKKKWHRVLVAFLLKQINVRSLTKPPLASGIVNFMFT